MSAVVAPGADTPARRTVTQAARDTAFVLTGFPIALPAFIVVAVGVPLGVGLAVLWVGFVILALTLVVARGVANLQRLRVVWCEQRPLPPAGYRTAPAGSWFLRRMTTRLRDPQAWRDVAHALVELPLTCVTWSLGLAWTTLVLNGPASIVLAWAQPGYPDRTDLLDLLGIHDAPTRIAISLVVAAVALALLPWVMRALASAHVALVRVLLANPAAAENAELRARADQLAQSRAAAAEAEASTLRRVERDIHDGPQQRLVRLTMDLESVRHRLEGTPEAVGPLVDSALEQTQEALAELRALSRGIAPPVLADRGLAAALSAAAGRSPVPVSLDLGTDPAQRYPASAENTVYYVVAEALTNVAKHSGAQSATVSLARVGDTLYVQVADDGVGGAHLGKGHGLAGLHDRVAGVDGRLEVHSPDGQGTVVSAQVPVAERG